MSVDFSGMGHMGGTNTVKLVDAATAMTKLKLPEMLAADSETATEITYTVTAQVGETAFKAGGKDADNRVQRLLLRPRL